MLVDWSSKFRRLFLLLKYPVSLWCLIPSCQRAVVLQPAQEQSGGAANPAGMTAAGRGSSQFSCRHECTWNMWNVVVLVLCRPSKAACEEVFSTSAPDCKTHFITNSFQTTAGQRRPEEGAFSDAARRALPHLAGWGYSQQPVSTRHGRRRRSQLHAQGDEAQEQKKLWVILKSNEVCVHYF